MTLDSTDEVTMADYLRESRTMSATQVGRHEAVHDLDSFTPVERLAWRQAHSTAASAAH